MLRIRLLLNVLYQIEPIQDAFLFGSPQMILGAALITSNSVLGGVIWYGFNFYNKKIEALSQECNDKLDKLRSECNTHVARLEQQIHDLNNSRREDQAEMLRVQNETNQTLSELSHSIQGYTDDFQLWEKLRSDIKDTIRGDDARRGRD